MNIKKITVIGATGTMGVTLGNNSTVVSGSDSSIVVNGNDNVVDNSSNTYIDNSSHTNQTIMVNSQNNETETAKENPEDDLHELVSVLSNQYLEMYDLDELVEKYGLEQSFDIVWYLRNYYYAQEGFLYKNELGRFFKGYPWYLPYNSGKTKQEVTELLGERARHNMDLIDTWEKKNNSPHTVVK